jgi:hypothetical protein
MATTNKEVAPTEVNGLETPPKHKRVNSNRNLIWAFRSVSGLSLLLTFGSIPIALFTPDVEAKLTFSPILLMVYFYYVFLFTNCFTYGLQKHKKLYRDATPEEILAGIKVAAEKDEGFSKGRVWERKCLFVDKVQVQQWTREQRQAKTFYVGFMAYCTLMLGIGYVCLLIEGYGATTLKVALGCVSLKDAHLSLFEVIISCVAVIILSICLVPFLWAANRVGWNWGALNLVSMVRDDIEKDKAQCLREGGDSDRSNWWIHHIGDIETAYSESDEEQKVGSEKGKS